MSTRAEQREDTRNRIVEAALDCFSKFGFQGASTREIARQAGTNQGLITYHFSSKEDLWRAAVDHIFGQVREQIGDPTVLRETPQGRERARTSIRAYVRFVAAHPELFRLMVGEGTSDDPRMHWLVDKHLKPLYETSRHGAPEVDEELRPHLHYVMAGAASVIFAVAPECRQLTGLDPTTSEAVERHANLVADLLVPAEAS